MDWRWVLLSATATTAVTLVVVVVLVRALRPHIQRRFFAGTGVERWHATAAQLSWRDRWVLFWANSRGRAVPPRLAAQAVERGEVTLAMIERSTAKKSPFRRFWLWLGGVWIVVGVAEFLLIALGGAPCWGLLAPAAGLFAVFAAIGPIQARQARLIRRSVELNRRQLDARD